MKKWLKILLIILAILIVLIFISLATSYGRLFWQSAAAPVLKPFSEACGAGSTSSYKVDCACHGVLTRDIKLGSTEYRCLGQCGECKCYKQDWSTYETTGKSALSEVDCATFSNLKWAFPLK